MTTSFERLRLRLTTCALAAVVATAGTVWAADPSTVLVQGQGTAITVQDVLGDATRVPAELRDEVLGRPATVAQMATNLYIFRRIAEQASAQGMAQRPEVAAAMRAAQDKVLAEAWLAELDDKNRPSAEAALLKAEALYKANPKRFAMEEEVHARHILVSGLGEEARSKAQDLLQQLKGGADFAALAKQASDDKGSGARGGDLGFFGRGKMVEPFEQAAYALTQPGQLSDLVESQFGYHIIRLEARRPAGTRPFAEVRDALVQEVQSSVTQDARATAAGKLREEGKVDVQAIEAFAKSRQPAASPQAKP